MALVDPTCHIGSCRTSPRRLYQKYHPQWGLVALHFWQLKLEVSSMVCCITQPYHTVPPGTRHTILYQYQNDTQYAISYCTKPHANIIIVSTANLVSIDTMPQTSCFYTSKAQMYRNHAFQTFNTSTVGLSILSLMTANIAIKTQNLKFPPFSWLFGLTVGFCPLILWMVRPCHQV